MKISVPERPEDRRVIVAIEEDEYNRCTYDDGPGRDLLRTPHTWSTPIPLPEGTRAHPVVARLLDEGRLNAGDVLLQSPFRFDEYQPVQSYAEDVALAKHFIFAELCRRLGARAVTVSSLIRESDEGTVSVDIAGNKARVKASASGAQSKVESFAGKLDLHDVLDPVLDLEAARQLLVDTHLQGDPVLAGLFRARGSGGGTLLKRSYTIEATREASTRLSLLGKIKMPLFVAVDGDFEKLSKRKESYLLTYVVDF